jgi:hypothetical protein
VGTPGREDPPDLCVRVFHWVSSVAQRWLLGGQAARAGGGSLTRSNSAVQAVSQGQDFGRCRVIRRAEVATRAGTVISLRRMVGVVALASCGSVRLAAARVRLNAMTASTSQAAFAVNTPDGRCASAEFFRSEWTCSMIAWPRWVLSAATVSRTLGSVVVKNAWNRHTSNRVSVLLPGSSRR